MQIFASGAANRSRNASSMIVPLTYVTRKCKTSRKCTILKIWFLFETSWNYKKHKHSNISIKTQDFVWKMSGNYFSWVLGRTLPLWAKMSQVWKYTFLSQKPKPYLEPCRIHWPIWENFFCFLCFWTWKID